MSKAYPNHKDYEPISVGLKKTMHYDKNLDFPTNLEVVDTKISQDMQLFAHSSIAEIKLDEIYKIKNKVIALLEITSIFVILGKKNLIIHDGSKNLRRFIFYSSFVSCSALKI